MAIELVFLNFIIPGIFGLLLGNFATTAYHRIPLRKPINGISQKHGLKPHCSHCGHTLKFYEYLPLLSWISTGFKCNYCHKRTDTAYFILEVTGMITAIIASFLIPLGLSYVMFASAWVVTFLIIVMYVKYSKLYPSILAFWAVLVTLLVLL